MEENIIKLAEILNEYGKSHHYYLWHDFMQIMYVLKKVKTGYWAQTDDKKELEMIAPYVKSLGLYISFKHQGYITYNKSKYNSWNGPWFGVKRKNIGTFYLGYPHCCEAAYIQIGPFSNAHIYYILKQILVDRNIHAYKTLKQYIGDMVFLEEYTPCTLHCEESHKRAERFKNVFLEFKGLLPQNYLGQRRKEVIESMIKGISDIENPPIMEQFKKHSLPKLEKHHYKHLFKLEDEFYKEIESAMANPSATKEIVEKGKRLIEKI